MRARRPASRFWGVDSMAGVMRFDQSLCTGRRFPQIACLLARSNETELGVSVRARISRCEIKKNWRTRHDSNVWPPPSEGVYPAELRVHLISPSPIDLRRSKDSDTFHRASRSKHPTRRADARCAARLFAVALRKLLTPRTCQIGRLAGRPQPTETRCLFPLPSKPNSLDISLRRERSRIESTAGNARSNESKSFLRGADLGRIVGDAAATEAMESTGAGIKVVFSAAGGAYGPNVADKTKPHHHRLRVLHRVVKRRPTSRRNIHTEFARPRPACGACRECTAQSRSGLPPEMQSR
jgi:hypothetical protein